MVPDHRLKGACVLLVENDEPTAKLVTAVLRDEGCNVQVVKGGLPGLALLLAGLQVTAALLDLRLPDVSGLDVARFLKACAGSRGLPVIGLSANGKTQGAALAAGCDAFVPKPIDAETLVSAIVRCLP